MIIKAIPFFMFSCMIIAKPLYGDKQLTLMLETHCKMIDSFPNLLGIHIYKNKEGRVLQLDIDIQDTNNNYAIREWKQCRQLGNIPIPIPKFISLNTIQNQTPAGFESGADCALISSLKIKYQRKSG